MQRPMNPVTSTLASCMASSMFMVPTLIIVSTLVIGCSTTEKVHEPAVTDLIVIEQAPLPDDQCAQYSAPGICAVQIPSPDPTCRKYLAPGVCAFPVAPPPDDTCAYYSAPGVCDSPMTPAAAAATPALTPVSESTLTLTTPTLAAPPAPTSTTTAPEVSAAPDEASSAPAAPAVPTPSSAPVADQ